MNHWTMSMRIVAILSLLGTSCTSLRAADQQDEHLAIENVIDSTAMNAVYVELAGNTVFYTVNYDRMITENVNLRLGMELID